MKRAKVTMFTYPDLVIPLLGFYPEDIIRNKCIQRCSL